MGADFEACANDTPRLREAALPDPRHLELTAEQASQLASHFLNALRSSAATSRFPETLYFLQACETQSGTDWIIKSLKCHENRFSFCCVDIPIPYFNRPFDPADLEIAVLFTIEEPCTAEKARRLLCKILDDRESRFRLLLEPPTAPGGLGELAAHHHEHIRAPMARDIEYILGHLSKYTAGNQKQ